MISFLLLVSRNSENAFLAIFSSNGSADVFYSFTSQITTVTPAPRSANGNVAANPDYTSTTASVLKTSR